MSRCLPYPPPPGYSAKIAGGGTLIGSIKLLRETEKDAITERKKERKRERKEKREKKERVKEEANVSDRGKKRKHKEEKAYKLAQGTNDDSEHLERSNITEEFGQPCCPQIPCTSDTSEDSNRRKRHCPNPETPETGIRARGTILRIRLAPKKPETTSIVPTHLKIQEELQPISTILRNHVELRQANEPSSSRRNEFTSQDKKIQRADLFYQELVENWVPPSLSLVKSISSDKDDELGWLTERKEQRCKHPKTDVTITSSSGSTLWPQARFLPETELYALPFAVPF